MRSLIVPGARQIASNEDRHREPGENPDLERRRDPANDDVQRQAGDGAKTCEKTWSNEGAMTRQRQRVLLRRRMHQRVDITPYRREKAHGPVSRLCNRRAPNSLQTLGHSRLSE